MVGMGRCDIVGPLLWLNSILLPLFCFAQRELSKNFARIRLFGMQSWKAFAKNLQGQNCMGLKSFVLFIWKPNSFLSKTTSSHQLSSWRDLKHVTDIAPRSMKCVSNLFTFVVCCTYIVWFRCFDCFNFQVNEMVVIQRQSPLFEKKTNNINNNNNNKKESWIQNLCLNIVFLGGSSIFNHNLRLESHYVLVLTNFADYK